MPQQSQSDTTERLKVHAERITEIAQIRLGNTIYQVLANEMEQLEHAQLWLGNGHHAAQNMCEDIMEVLNPLLETTIKAMVLRDGTDGRLKSTAPTCLRHSEEAGHENQD